MDYDLLIVGGGLAGNCLALALKNSGLKIAIIEAQPRDVLQAAALGDRALALAAGTVDALKTLNLWQGVEHAATPIEQIHVSDKGHFGKTRLSAHKENVAALGYVITARDLETHIADQIVTAENVTLYCPARVMGLIADENAAFVSLKCNDEFLNLTAKLVVGADGGQSSVRQLLNIQQHISDYGQTALVTTVTATRPHKNIAYERFTNSGPLALLPMGTHNFAVVWTRTTEEAESLMLGSKADFIEQLQQCFGYRLGELNTTRPRRAFPLSLIRAETMISQRTVIIGNAAHQLHPVAGQGFNLGLRDVIVLAEMVQQRNEIGDIGATAFLTRYAQNRQADQSRTINFTDTVVRLFSNEWLALAAFRNAGLALLDVLPFAKTVLARHAMGYQR
ncbi:MAG: 2-octaprenyl-6-methoxyphenyl hydroxylase [Methylococcales bacterium]|nr:2-octaprenyl-6-methoxyphenyl hydroxylase [Methylococcales bacterium]MDD5755370.1 2-octaprenyl-6-methoxyphenyl hydroxylase [Methylococcales bacterium]